MMTTLTSTEAEKQAVSLTFEECEREFLEIIAQAERGELSQYADNNVEIARDLMMLWNIRTNPNAMSPHEGAQWVLALARRQVAKCAANKQNPSK